MATATDMTVPSHFDTDATYQSFVTKISAILDAVGLIKTADTGQINPATTVRPGVANTASGYEIRRFADLNQFAKPIYIKIEYGIGGAVTRPSVWITVGTGSNGAGSLSGLISLRRQGGTSVTDALGATVQARASHSDGAFFLHVGEISTPTRLTAFVIVERPRDADGVIDNGWIMMFSSNSLDRIFQVASGSVGTGDAIVGDALWEFEWHQDSGGPDVVIFPCPIGVGGKPRFPLTLVYRNTLLTTGVPITVDWLGEERTMFPVGAASGWGTSSVSPSPLVPWE